jgi:hypothetical protein
MNEYGVSRICPCGKSFTCTDGDYFCSSKCYDQYESRQDEEEED